MSKELSEALAAAYKIAEANGETLMAMIIVGEDDNKLNAIVSGNKFTPDHAGFFVGWMAKSLKLSVAQVAHAAEKALYGGQPPEVDPVLPGGETDVKPQ